MLHRPSFVLGAALLCAAPLHAQSALDTARVEVTRGRAVLIGGGADVQTIRRSDTVRAEGASQLEVSAGSRVHVGFDGTMGLDVHGPASFEWSAEGSRIHVAFSELAWADIEARRGEHIVDLPADWRASIGRSSLHLRGIAGGPVELRLDAGQPVVVDWRGGGRTLVRPPVAVYPGSSVRLDQPRHMNEEPRRDERALAWSSDAGDRDPWPWRPAGGGDTAQELQERNAQVGRTRTFDELPGIAGGSIERMRALEADGTGRMRDLPRFEPAAPSKSMDRRGDVTSAQVPVAPVEAPAMEITRRPEPMISERVEVQPTAPMREVAPVKAAPTMREAVKPAPAAPVFDQAQWRGIDRSKLNGAGVVAAERGSGVEFRILGAGRTKVIVSGSSPSPRWCFTPIGDYLMHPGAVAVFENDGALRMSFGTVETYDRVADRPAFSEL